MCRLICILVPGSADGFCGSSDPAVLVCSAVWGLFSFIALIAWLRWQGDHSSASDVPTAELLELLSHTQAVNERPLSAAAAWGIVDAPVALQSAPRPRLQRPKREVSGSALPTPRAQ
jgi:hypothetical protein